MSLYEWLTVTLAAVTVIANIVLAIRAEKRGNTPKPEKQRARIERRKR